MNYSNLNDLFKNSVDYNQVLNTQRRNIETASEIGQAVVENAQAISKRQAEIARDNVQGAMEATKKIFTSGTPETNFAKQSEFAKEAFETTMANMREVSEMAAKSCFEIFDVLSSRATESMEELSSAATSRTAKKKSA